MGIVIPFVEESRSIKDLLVAMLASSPPLTIKKLHFQLRKKYAVSVTYQAVHKALLQLVRQNVLTKKDRTYFISVNWINRLEEFVGMLKQRSSKYKQLQNNLENGASQIFIFNSYENAQNFKKELQQEFFNSDIPIKIYAAENYHVKSPLAYSEKSLNFLNQAREANASCYILVRGNTPLDEWGAEYYRTNFAQIKTGVDCAHKCEIMVLGDIIFQLFVPQIILEALDEIYRKAKKVNEINVIELYNRTYRKRAKVKVIITKNAELAEQIKNKIIEQFK